MTLDLPFLVLVPYNGSTYTTIQQSPQVFYTMGLTLTAEQQLISTSLKQLVMRVI